PGGAPNDAEANGGGVAPASEPTAGDISAALNWYQNAGYQNLNENLREGKPLSERQAESVRAIDHQFSREPRRAGLTLYRGAGVSATLFEGRMPNGFNVNRANVDDPAVATQLRTLIGLEFQDLGYLSTSRSQKIALEKFVPGSYDITQYGGTGLVEIRGTAK